MLSGKRYVIALIALITVNIAVFVYRSRREPHLRLGDRFPNFAGLRTRTATWTLVLYGDPMFNEAVRRIGFAHVLAKMYKDRGLVVVAIWARRDSQTHSFLVAPSIQQITDDGGWARRLHTNGSAFWIYLVDSSEHVRFAAPYAQPLDMRQLVERFMFGRPTYARQASAPRLEPGDKFPSLAIVGRSRTAVPDDWAKNRDLVVITARCAACSLENTYNAYAEWERRARTVRRATVLFSEKFTSGELDGVLKKSVRAPVLQAVTSIPGVEDDYGQESLFDEDVLVVTVDEEGTVRKLRTWEAFVADTLNTPTRSARI